MNLSSLDIYLIDDINKIIRKYQKQINHIYELENDLYNNILNFTRNDYDDIFKNIYVNIDNNTFIILIDRNRFYNRTEFNEYFHNLCEVRKMKLFYIFMDILLKKYKILDLQNDAKLFQIFNDFIFNYIFEDYAGKTIKQNISYDYIFSYKLINNLINRDILNIDAILNCLTRNTKIMVKARIPHNFI